MAATRSTASRSGSGPRTSTGSGSSASAGPKTSSGKSRNTGPRCGVTAARAASCTCLAASSALNTVPADLVIEATMGTWSSSCSDPAPHRRCGARPPSTTRGVPLKWADVIAEIPFVTPGPAVSTARPGVRVSLA